MKESPKIDFETNEMTKAEQDLLKKKLEDDEYEAKTGQYGFSAEKKQEVKKEEPILGKEKVRKKAKKEEG
jgi:hypothetical protein